LQRYSARLPIRLDIARMTLTAIIGTAAPLTLWIEVFMQRLRGVRAART
jgi:hypothetical protein